MPPQLQELLQNRRLLAVVGGAVVLILLLVIGIPLMSGGNSGGKDGARKLEETERILATVDTMGRAIEIQALLAREKIDLIREDVEGGKATLRFEENATTDERDRALVTLVQSGLMDKNVGLEIFDKTDLTASREEKRIKLVRARNGELARLIRKIDPIQDASVFISMPEPTIFKRDMVPPTATVQVTLASGENLTRDKVRSIINLLVGSIEGLDAKHVSLTDTNGRVYNSVLDTTDELMDKLQERDHYMEQKVHEQLDKLLGANQYVATVSTYLREASKSQMQLNYNPDQSTVMKSSKFEENLNSESHGSNSAAGPVSSYVPAEIDVTGSGSSQAERGYQRNGQELEYNNGKTQTNEEFVPGMIEDITVAVTVDAGAFPSGMSMEDFQTLIARTASPLVNPENVTVVIGKPEALTPLTPAQNENPFIAALSGIPWWLWVIAGGGVALIFLMLFVAALSKPKVPTEQITQQQKEIEQLRELAQNQSQQIQQSQQQTQEMLQAQQQQLAQIATQRPTAMQQTIPQQQGVPLKEELPETQAIRVQDGTDETAYDAQGIKSWIEST